MIGAIALAVAIVVVLPVGMLMSGAVVAALFGQASAADADARYEGSELVGLNK